MSKEFIELGLNSVKMNRHCPYSSMLLQLQVRFRKFTIAFVRCVFALFVLFANQNARAQNAPAQTEYTRGLWFDQAGIPLDSMDGTIDKYRNLGITRVHIVVSEPIDGMGEFKKCKTKNSDNECVGDECRKCAVKNYPFAFSKWVSRPGRAELGEFVRALNDKKFRVIITIWPVPDKGYLKSLISGDNNLLQFVRKNPVYGVEVEDEPSNWNIRWNVGWKIGDLVYPNLKAAEEDLMSKLRKNLPGVKIGVTPSPKQFSPDNFKDDALLQNADFISFQTYQPVCAKPRNIESCNYYDISGEYAAGKMQQNAIDLIKKLGLEKKELILGLPAFAQQNAAQTGESNMYTASKTAICKAKDPHPEVNLTGDAYWSAAWIMDKHPETPKLFGLEDYALRFLNYCKENEIAARACNTTNKDDLGQEMIRVCKGIMAYDTHQKTKRNLPH